MAQNVQNEKDPSTVQGVGQPTFEQQQAALQARLEELGLPPADPTRGQADAATILAQAGLSGVGQTAGVTDSKKVEQANHIATQANQLYGTGSLPPVAPPKIDLTPELKTGAETFAANVDEVMNNFLLPGGHLDAPEASPFAGPGATLAKGLDQLLFGGQLGFADGRADSDVRTRGDGQIDGDDARAMAEAELGESRDGLARDVPLAKSAGGQSAQSEPDSNQSEKGIGALGATRSALTADGDAAGPGEATPEGGSPSDRWPQQLEGIKGGKGEHTVSFDPKTGMPISNPNLSTQDVGSKENLSAVLEAAGLKADAMTKAGALTPDAMKSLEGLSADRLLAMFLILNINDPNNSPETHNLIQQLATKLRQQALGDGKAKAKMAELLVKHAEELLERTQTFGLVVTIISIIIALVVTVISFGTAAPAAMVAVGGTITSFQVLLQFIVQLITELGKQAVMIIVTALITLMLQVVTAVTKKQAADAAADASDAQNDVERVRKRAGDEQAIIDEENAIMQTIMESKNQMVDAVIKMLNAMFATQNKVMSAGMS